MSGSPSLDELLEQVRNGDDGAMRRFLGAARTVLFRWAIIRTGSLDDAEDLTQEGLMKVARSLDGFEGRGRCTTWLYSVLSRTHLDGVRRAATRRRAEDHASSIAAAQVQPPRLDHEVPNLVRSYLSGLTERQREIVNLVDLEGFTPAEVADMTGLERSTVRVHLHRGRRALRTVLEEKWDHA